MDNAYAIIISAISGAIVVIIGAISTYIVNTKKQKGEDDRSSNAQAFEVYKELTDRMKKDYSEVQSQYRELEKSYLDCRETCAGLRKDVEYFKKELEEALTELSKKRT